jgi:hypothetical protein
VIINLEAVHPLNPVVDTRKILELYIKKAGADFTLKVIVLFDKRLVSFQAVRQRNLAYEVTLSELPEIPVYGGFAYGWVFLFNFAVYLFDRGVCFQFYYGVQYNLPLRCISLHTFKVCSY